ncbi:MAG: hypothetical protein HOC71_17225 [Candidatus Latescibacteria bacterium]|nr:hypothetical protein [Candidatus Latescibacterota bacterium]
MRFDIKSHSPLAGRTSLPGDTGLTLSTMAIGMLSPEPVAVVNPSQSQHVAGFKKFLQQYGAEFNDVQDGFSMQGKLYDMDIIIGDDVPDSVLHLVICGAVFSGKSVTILNKTDKKVSIVKYLPDIMKNTGLTDESITEEEDTISIHPGTLNSDTEVTVTSSWAFEAVGVSTLASRSNLTVVYPVQTVSHSERLLTLLGCQIVPIDNNKSHETELARRIAKASGKTSMEIRRFEWNGVAAKTILIPGDTSLAAAVAGTAAVIPKSDVVLKDVLWERSRRGFFDVLRRMKGNISYDHVCKENSFDSADVRISWSKLEGIQLTAEQATALTAELLLLGAVAASTHGETVISDCNDEASLGREAFTILARGLEMLGAHVGDYTDGIAIKGGNELKGDLVDSGGRADVALALAVAGMNASGTTTVFGFDGSAYPVGSFMDIVKVLSS